MELSLCKIDWIAISAIASFAMVAVTLVTLCRMKHQWEEDRRPNLIFTIAVTQAWYALKISNIGKQNASNIKLNFNKEFVDSLTIVNAKRKFINLKEKSFTIEGGQSKYLLICQYEKREEVHNEINIAGKYCGKYIINESLDISDYAESLIVNDDLTTDVGYIKKGLIVQNDKYYPIQKSLDIIAKYVQHKEESEKQ